MNVSELREKLLLLPGDLPVILSKDAEGNGYNELYCLEVRYVADEDNEPVHPEDEEEYECEEGDPKALYLWP